ncbi:MAG: hypothetical protein MJ097_00430 [Dorea sp.]|nr:hypothetical protein [Dorea sp.]
MSDLLNLRARVGIDTSEYEKGLEDARGKASSFGKFFTSAMSATAKGMAAVGSAALAAVSKIAIDSTKMYADYEQLVGGVETLFGAQGMSLEEYAVSVGKSTESAAESYQTLIEAQNTALANADRAYMTAGLSANEYMETITGFAASLKQSTANEVEAANVADMAIQDMSDNANKMGSDMSSIQTAYQGFAKQNYTMLDNLKLGYGGTKEEMQRLLTDAEKLSGVHYDINQLDDVYNAIHVIQTDLGITGTTAKEAMQTISGSAAMTKSAWDNVLIAIGKGEGLDDALDGLMTGIFGNSSGGGLLNNIIPRIQTVMEGIGQFVAKAGPLITKQIPALIKSIVPGLIKSTATLAKSVITALPSIVSGLVNSIFTSLDDLWLNLKNSSDNPFGDPIIMGLGLALDAVFYFKNIVTSIFGGLIDLFGRLGTGLSPIFDMIVSGWRNVFKEPGEEFTAFEMIATNIINGIGSVFSWLGGIVDTVTAGIVSGVTWVKEQMETEGTPINEFVSALGTAWSDAKQLVDDAVGAILRWIDDLVLSANTDGTVINDFISAIGSYIESAAGFWAEAIPKITGFITDLKNSANTDGTVVNKVFKGISLTLGGLLVTATFVINIVKGLIDGLTKLLNGDFSGAWETVKKSAMEAWDDVKRKIEESPLGKLIDDIKLAVDALSGAFPGFSGAASSAINAVAGLAGNLIELFRKLKEYIDGFNSMERLGFDDNGNVIFPAMDGFTPTTMSATGYDNPQLMDIDTVFGYSKQGFHIGGDRGSYKGGELVYSHDNLMQDISVAAGNREVAAMMGQMINIMAEYFPQFAKGKSISINGRALVGQIVDDMDEALGTRVYSSRTSFARG